MRGSVTPASSLTYFTAGTALVSAITSSTVILPTAWRINGRPGAAAAILVKNSMRPRDGGGEGDEGVGPVGGGVFGQAEGGFEVVGLDADDESGWFAFSGGEDGFGALEAFGFGEGPELAGELGPGEALDAAAVEEDGFFGEGARVELAVGQERRLHDGEDAAEGRGGWRGGEKRGE